MKQTEAMRYRRVTRFMLISGPAFGAFFLNISSMRRVTRKPPNIDCGQGHGEGAHGLAQRVTVRAAASMAPTMTIAEIALVTAISGVCKAGVTFHTTW